MGYQYRKHETLADTFGMTFEEYFGHSEHIRNEEYFALVEEDTAPENNNYLDLSSIQFPEVVLDTHERVRSIIIEQYHRQDGLKFLSDWTGRGKTTGIIKALGELTNLHPSAKVLIITKEIFEVDNLWRSIMATLPDVSVVGFSGVHAGKSKVGWTPVRTDVRKEDVRQAQIVISTHASGLDKSKRFLHNERDLLLVDEYPDPVSSGVMTVDVLAKAAEELKYHDKKAEKGLNTAVKWVSELSKGRITSDCWIEALEATVSHPSEALERLLTTGKMFRQGKGFLRKNGNSFSLVWAEFNLPLEERAIVFSATNAYEGWHIDPKRRGIGRTGQPTDYSDLVLTLKDMPSGIKDSRNFNLMKTSKSRGLILGSIQDALLSFPADEKILLLVPKKVSDWLTAEDCLPSNVSILNWGRGIGTNSFKDYRFMVVLGLFHMASDKLAADSVGHGARKQDVLNNNQAVIRTAKENHHHRWVIQMLNRIQIRQMEGNGLKAKPAEVIWIANQKDQETVCDIVGKNFLGAVIQQEKKDDDLKLVVDCFDVLTDNLVTAIKGQKDIVNKVKMALRFYENRTDQPHIFEVTSADLKRDFNIDLKQRGIPAKLAYQDYGEWIYAPATKGKYARPHTWTKA